jgi:F0F1-type ATP synthase delta subunit
MAPSAAGVGQPAPVAAADTILSLPVLAVSKVDIGRLLREVEALDNFMRQAAVRQPGTPIQPPKTSRLMDEIIATNKVNVLIEADRNRLLHFLQDVYKRAPVIHISFSADPSAAFVQKLTTWLRQNIHPFVLLQIGLQPNMGAGCVVRTTNKVFDFSLRNRFTERREMLIQRLKEAV